MIKIHRIVVISLPQNSTATTTTQRIFNFPNHTEDPIEHLVPVKLTSHPPTKPEHSEARGITKFPHVKARET